ncbi:MAG: hypothetical protein FJ023_06170 [Chloroflexi bacterium]|nr:hypothetical protein [Chloroflexota bacterium]
MNYRSLLFFLALTTIILPSLFLSSPIPVHATNVTIAPTSGAVGTSILIEGNGFSGRLATIQWDNQTILSKIPISETGELKCNLKIPPSFRGNHIIEITDDSNWASSTASATFTVLPGIEIVPRIGRKYTPVTVIGNGFAAFEKDIKITWDNTVLPTSTNANHLGIWSINFDVPETNNGEHSISAFSSSTDASEIGEHRFIVAPAAKVEPTAGPVGTKIKIDGFGFRTGEDGITITWDGEIIVCNIVGEADGSWSTTLSIPPSTKGNHTIGVYGSSFTPRGIVPDTIFDVVPHLELQPASGNKGTKITVSGTGFNNGETITLSFEGMTLDAKAIADNTGSFSAAFEAPQIRIKDNKVKATGSTGNSAQAIFTTHKIAPPTPTLSSPEQRAKLATFDSMGDVFLRTAKFLIEIIAFRDSRHRGFGAPTATFDWSDINAEDEVSYTLQIARGDDFSSQALLKENLVDSKYALSKNDILTQDSYSWRVKAVDDIGNESPWSEVQEFEVIPMSNQVLIFSLVILIILIAAIVVGGMLNWRMQRTKREFIRQ